MVPLVTKTQCFQSSIHFLQINAKSRLFCLFFSFFSYYYFAFSAANGELQKEVYSYSDQLPVSEIIHQVRHAHTHTQKGHLRTVYILNVEQMSLE